MHRPYRTEVFGVINNGQTATFQFRAGYRRSRRRRGQGDHGRCDLLRRADVPGRPIAQAVDQVKARGVSYFSAAGNDGRLSYESAFLPSGTFFDIGFGPEEAHDFDPDPEGVDTCQRITVPGGAESRQ